MRYALYWLQTGDWHADLRVPVDRPDFNGVTSLAGCSRDQRIWLTGQTAFAGMPVVEARLCTWHRRVDLSAGLDKDVGELQFIDDDTLYTANNAQPLTSFLNS